MKFIVNSLLIIFIMNLISPTLVIANDICFSENSANKLVVTIEDCKLQTDELNVTKQQKGLLLKEVEVYKNIEKLQIEKIDILQGSIEDYRTLLKTQDEQYKTLMEANKPSVMKIILGILGALAVGAIIGYAAHN